MLERKFLTDDPQSATRYLIFPIWLLAIYAIGKLISESATICLWIVCAFFLFLLLDPVAEYLKARNWPRALTALFLVLIATLITVGTFYALGYMFSGIVVELEQSKKIFMEAFQSFSQTWDSWAKRIPGMSSSGANVGDQVSKVEVVQSSPLGGDMGGTILHSLGSAATVFTFSILVPILTFFFLAERDGFGRIISRAYQYPSLATATWDRIVRSTRAFFVGNLVLALITYPLFLMIFWLFSVPSLFATAALATFFNVIPFAGAVLSGILPALALYSQTQTFGAAAGVYGCCVAIHFVIADFVTPKILGSQVNINATTSTIALVVWGELWGGMGLILAIPLTSILKILFEGSNFFWLQWVAGLMSEDIDTALKIPSLRVKPAKTDKAEKT